MSDITFTCKDCGQPFIFSEGEQEYYQDRGLAIPKRCSRCRLKRRSALSRRPGRTFPEPPEEKKEEKKEVKPEPKAKSGPEPKKEGK